MSQGGTPTGASREDAAPSGKPSPPPWRVIVVEDEQAILEHVIAYLGEKVFDGRRLELIALDDFDRALSEIQQRQVDLLILDVFRGKVSDGADPAGIRLLEEVKKRGFVPTVLLTAHPEKVSDQKSHFVRLVGKESGYLERLYSEIASLFDLRIPQMYRAMVTHPR